MCDRPPGLFEWAFRSRNFMKHLAAETVCEPIFVGQVANLRPIGNRPAPGAENDAPASGGGFFDPGFFDPGYDEKTRNCVELSLP
jgi:hypothetical protein